MRKVLLIDNSQHNVDRFHSLLTSDGLVIEWCDSSAQASAMIRNGQYEFAAIIIRMEIPGPPFALEVLQDCRDLLPSVPRIVVSSALTAMVAAPAYALGASDFLEIPLDRERVQSCMRSLISPQDTYLPLVEELNKKILGNSPALLTTFKKIAKIIPYPDRRILLIGDSGTGKELVAQAIHRLGPHNFAPCIPVNVGAIPATLIESELFGHEKGAFTGAIQQHIGYLEQAGKGTLFLDEIGDLDLSLQVKLLRVIQEKKFQRLKGTKNLPFEARLICATNRDLAVAAHEGTFRRDLYHRIAEVTIQVPPLREREGDVDLLINHFLEHYGSNSQIRLARETRTILRSYSFPGNVRELENIIKAALIECEGEVILPKHLPLKNMNVFLGSKAPTSHSIAEAAEVKQKSENVSTQDFNGIPVQSQASQKLFEQLTHILPENWLDLPYKEGIANYERAFDRVYLPHLMERYHHKVSRATKAAGIDRKTFERHWKEAALPPLRAEDENDE